MLRYEQDAEKYHPPPTAKFRLIRVKTSDEQAVALIGAAIQGGEAFENVASRPENSWNPQGGGLQEAKFEGDYKAGEFFGAAALNEQARTLEVGDWTGPFELGDFTCWLKLDAIERHDVDLYDAQLEIYQQLLSERQNNELARYISHLVERARVTDLETIRDRLVDIAAERYGPKG